jgi:sporulation protein YlmC with PRC-barrel domain
VTPLPAAPDAGAHLLDARLQLLDRQLFDSDGNPAGTVDDLELDGIEVGQRISEGTAAPRLSGVLSGHVLATRILGGTPPRSRLQTIPWSLVASVGVVVRLRPTDMVFETGWVEDWLRAHVIDHIPGRRSGGADARSEGDDGNATQ